MTEIWERDAFELADGVRAGEYSAVELLDLFLARVDKFDDELNAFCYVDRAGARRRATDIDAAIGRGEDPGPWAGVPMGVKELVKVAGWPDTHASLLYEHEFATNDATEAARLKAAGAVLVGLTTSPEFGSVNWTDSKLHGTTRNPWNLAMTPGGSSGGSAAAVAAGMMPICTGSDGGGSIRIPSAYSGLFGFKVSFGRVGAEAAFDNSLLSVPGPICRSVRDAARYVDAIAGPTVADPTSLPKPARPYERALLSGEPVAALRGMRAGYTATLGHALTDPEVEKLTYEAAHALAADAGITLVDLDIKMPNPARAWSILSALEVSSHHGDAAIGRLDECTPVTRGNFEQIDRLDPPALLRALRRRDAVLAVLAAAFDEVDFIMTPTTATPAFAAEGPPPMEIAGKHVGGMGSVPFCAPFNASGQPAVSIPVGLTADGLPVGLQVATRRHDEELVLACGLVAERERPWPKLAPFAYG